MELICTLNLIGWRERKRFDWNIEFWIFIRFVFLNFSKLSVKIFLRSINITTEKKRVEEDTGDDSQCPFQGPISRPNARGESKISASIR